MVKSTEIATKPGFKKTKVGWIPEDWKLVTLGDKFEFKNGINSDRSSYGSGIKFINVMEVINNSVITYSDISGTVNITSSQFEAYKVKYGDELFNRI